MKSALFSLLTIGIIAVACTALGLHCLCCPDQMCAFFGLP